MKKILKLVTSFALVVIMASSLVACKGNEQYQEEVLGDYYHLDSNGKMVVGNDDISGTLKIRAWDGGFGLEWIEGVISDFNDAFPNVTVKLSSSPERKVIFGELMAKENQKYDLISSESIIFEYRDQFESLDDVWSYKWQDETSSITEKMADEFVNYHKLSDNHYYTLPSYISWYGFVYNADIIEDSEVPKTTNELIALCNDLKSSGVVPTIFSGDTGVDYWNQIYCTWFAQYQGLEEFNQMQLGKVKQADGSYKTDVSSTYLEGTLKAMQVCEDILWYDNGNIYKTSVGEDYMGAQSKFFDNAAAFMANGAWIMNEMSVLYPDGPDFELKPMRTPVISSIVEKCTTISNDEELSSLITAIDNGETALTGTGYSVNQEDFNTVKDARSLCYIGGEAATYVVPKYAKNKGLAKLFLQFMYRDTSIDTHVSSNAGVVLPVKNHDFSDALSTVNKFSAQNIRILQNSKPFCINFKDKAFTPYIYAEGMNIEKSFGSQKSYDRTRAVAMYNNNKANYTANDNAKYKTKMQAAGIPLDD